MRTVHGISPLKNAVVSMDSSAWLAAMAVQALSDEALLTPKPGLVDSRGNGAHHDLSLPLLLLSARTLEPFFARMAIVASGSTIDLALRKQLGAIGRDAEHAMCQATRGINTHRGAIWALGLLVASAAHHGVGADEQKIAATAAQIAALPDRSLPTAESHGAQAARRFGAIGARGEAVSGFPHVLQLGLPALRRARAAGVPENFARVDALLAIMESLVDTCLLHRGEEEALRVAQQGARLVLEHGGSSTLDGRRALCDLERALLRLWASPGGAADLLAAALFLDRLASAREVTR